MFSCSLIFDFLSCCLSIAKKFLELSLVMFLCLWISLLLAWQLVSFSNFNQCLLSCLLCLTCSYPSFLPPWVLLSVCSLDFCLLIFLLRCILCKLCRVQSWSCYSMEFNVLFNGFLLCNSPSAGKATNMKIKNHTPYLRIKKEEILSKVDSSDHVESWLSLFTAQ